MKWMLTVAKVINVIIIFSVATGTLAAEYDKKNEKTTPAVELKTPKRLLIHGNIVSSTLLNPGNVVPEHLTEFGFFHSGWTIDEIPEVANFATFVDVYYHEIEILTAARENGLKAWIQLAPIFFDGHPTYKKREDYLERWQRARENLKQFEDIILSFDPMDEPFHRSNMRNNDLKIYLEEIAGLLKEDFPKANIALTFTQDTVTNKNFIKFLPQKYNLLGVDHYVGENFQKRIVEKLITKTKHLNINYYLIPRAFKTSNQGYGGISEVQLINRARQAYDFARNNPRVIAIYPFVWETFIGKGDYYLGVDKLNTVQEEYRRIGAAISKFR
ncbi:hypothetical protein MO867_11035 [Microbulbifer sp. OS29]|uniref:Uncharacterized protein n=1 Tax=Microbulbifer okhotskensis TaxID=2926617 RepID=A0A9X2J5Y3_9GAMM|nr:hypothetical protein [Microbulbifer okhotskensis]MCO1334874.1 hypothetical protein [Microbulbifer okhotskensis]